MKIAVACGGRAKGGAGPVSTVAFMQETPATRCTPRNTGVEQLEAQLARSVTAAELKLARPTLAQRIAANTDLAKQPVARQGVRRHHCGGLELIGNQPSDGAWIFLNVLSTSSETSAPAPSAIILPAFFVVSKFFFTSSACPLSPVPRPSSAKLLCRETAKMLSRNAFLA